MQGAPIDAQARLGALPRLQPLSASRDSKEMDPYMQKTQFQMSGQTAGVPDRAVA